MVDIIPPFLCPVCDSPFVGQIAAQEVLPDGKEIFIQTCPTCNLHITYPRLENPQSDYSEIDLEAWEKKYGAIDRGELLHDRHQNYLEELSWITNLVAKGGFVLDVGCHSGWLLGYLQKTGLYNLEGVEPSPTLAQIAKRRLNIPIHQVYLQEVQEREAYYDALITTDVLEHINPEDQIQFLKAARERLKEGGYLFIKTPNVKFTSLKADAIKIIPDILKKTLIMHSDVWDAKEHVVLWDAQNLVKIVEKLDFSVVRVFVPRPVETRNSPLGALLARRSLYYLSQLLGGSRRVPTFAQDIFLIAQK